MSYDDRVVLTVTNLLREIVRQTDCKSQDTLIATIESSFDELARKKVIPPDLKDQVTMRLKTIEMDELVRFLE